LEQREHEQFPSRLALCKAGGKFVNDKSCKYLSSCSEAEENILALKEKISSQPATSW
jgi:hypothetical protein